MGDDDPLLVGVRAGTPDWQAIYLLHRSTMQRVARRILRARDTDSDKTEGRYVNESVFAGESADDVVHAVVERLRRDGLPRDLRNLEAFLVRATYTETLDLRRRLFIQRRGADGTQQSQTREVGLDTLVTAEVLDPTGEFSESVEDIVFLAKIRASLPKLLEIMTPNERRAFTGCILDGRQITEVADEMHVTRQRISQLVGAAGRRIATSIGLGRERR